MFYIFKSWVQQNFKYLLHDPLQKKSAEPYVSICKETADF